MADYGICIGMVGGEVSTNLLFERNLDSNSAFHIIKKGNVVHGGLNLSNQVEGESIISFPSVNSSGFLFITRQIVDKYNKEIPIIIAITTSLKDQVILYKNINELKRITKTIKTSLLDLFTQEKNNEKIKVLINNLMNTTFTDSWMNHVLTQKSIIESKVSVNKKSVQQEKIASNSIHLLQSMLKKNLDQAIYAIIVGNPVVVIGKNSEMIKLVIDTLSIFSPHRNLILNEVIGFFPKSMDIESYDLIGIYPEYKPKRRKNYVFIDLEKSKIQGGKKNNFCIQLIKELSEAEKKSKKLLNMLAERRINWLIMSAASLTQVESKESQKKAINDLMKKIDRDSIYLIGKILEQKNSLLYKQILSQFSLKARIFKALF